MVASNWSLFASKFDENIFKPFKIHQCVKVTKVVVGLSHKPTAPEHNGYGMNEYNIAQYINTSTKFSKVIIILSDRLSPYKQD